MAGADVTEAFAKAFRDFVTDGVPSSGENRPDKAEVREAGRLTGEELERIEDLALSGARSPVTVRVIAASNVAIANGLENGDTVDGVVMATGDVVLLTAQTTASQNGAYVVVASGAASRDPRYDSGNELVGAQFAASAGTNTGWIYAVRGNPVIGTDPISITRAYPTATIGAGSVANANLASMAAGTIKARLPGTSGPPTDETIATIGGLIGNILGLALWEVVTDSPYYSDRAYVLDQDGAKRTVWARRISDGSIVWFSELDAGVTEVIQARGQHAKLNDRLSAMGEWVSVANSEFFLAYWYLTDSDGTRRITKAIRRSDGFIVDFGQAPAAEGTGSSVAPVEAAPFDFTARNWPLVHSASTPLSSIFLPRVPASVYSWWESNPTETREFFYFSSVSNGQAATGMPKMRQLSQIRKIPASTLVETVRVGWDADIFGVATFDDDHDNPGQAVDPRWWAKYPLAVISGGHNETVSRTILQLSASGDARGLSTDKTAISDDGEVTYSVGYRKADEPNLLYIFRRIATNGIYSLLIFNDLTGKIVGSYRISGAGGQLYNVVRPCLDGSGLWFVWYPNPKSTQTDTYNFCSVMKLTWDLKWLAADGSLIADIRSGFTSSTFNPVNSGTLVVPTAVGDRMRLYDVREFVSGVLSIAWSWWTGEDDVGTMATNYIMRYNTATPTIRTPIKVGPDGGGGKGINDGGNYSYFGGTCFVKDNVLLSCEWAKASNPTNTEVNTYDISTSTPTLKANLETFADKGFRPQASTLFTWSQINQRILTSIGGLAVYNRGGYSGFTTQSCDIQPLLTATL